MGIVLGSPGLFLNSSCDNQPIPQTQPAIQEPKKTKLPTYQPLKTNANYNTTDFSNDTDEVLLARMLYGECRSCEDTEKIAVAHTALNRVNDGKRWNGETLREVILKPWQYSCFNKNNPNRKKLMNPNPETFESCLEIARGVINGAYQDSTNGATHYFNPNVVKPSWAFKLTKIGKIKNSTHEFYRED